MAGFLGSAYLLTLGWRMLYIWIFSGPRFMHNVMVVGAGETGKAIIQVINSIKPPYTLVGLIDDDLDKQEAVIEGYKVLGTCQQLNSLAEANNVSEIIVAITGRMQSTTFQTMIEAQEKGLIITRMPVAYEELLERVPVDYLEADWILRSFVNESRVSAFYSSDQPTVGYSGRTGRCAGSCCDLSVYLAGNFTGIGPAGYLHTDQGRKGR